MTQEAQDIAIAQACGFMTHKRPDGLVEWRWRSGHLIGRYPQGQCPSIVPKYTMDLNAMHEAVRCKRFDINPGYEDHLAAVCDPGDDCVDWWEDAHYRSAVINATAAQRAEAFIRTISMWRDDA